MHSCSRQLTAHLRHRQHRPQPVQHPGGQRRAAQLQPVLRPPGVSGIAGPQRAGRRRLQAGVRKLGGRQQEGHVALVAVGAEGLVEQEVEEAVHAQPALKHQQRLRAVHRHGGLRGEARVPRRVGAVCTPSIWRWPASQRGPAQAQAQQAAPAAHLVQLHGTPLRLRRQQRRVIAQRVPPRKQRTQPRGGAGEQGVEAGTPADAGCAEERGKRLLAALHKEGAACHHAWLSEE